MPQPDGPLLTSVYRKPTHTDEYLQWNSHHHLSAKFSVINTLKHRAKTVSSNKHLLKEEEDHLNESCSKLVISVTEHLVEVVDKLSTTTVVFFRSEFGTRSY